MFIISNLIVAVAELIQLVITLYTFVLIARVFISWVSASPYNPIVRIIYALTEPILLPLRRIIPAIPLGMGYIDLSPLVLFLLLHFLKSFLFRTLTELSIYLRGM